MSKFQAKSTARNDQRDLGLVHPRSELARFGPRSLYHGAQGDSRAEKGLGPGHAAAARRADAAAGRSGGSGTSAAAHDCRCQART